MMVREEMDEQSVDRILSGDFFASPDDSKERNRILRLYVEKFEKEASSLPDDSFARGQIEQKIEQIKDKLNPHRHEVGKSEEEGDPMEGIAA